VTPGGAAGQNFANAASLDAYRTLIGLDNGRGVGYDTGLFRPPLMLDPMILEREREQLLRLQQQQLFGAAMGLHQDSLNATSANPLASMIDLERAMSRPGGMVSVAPGLFTQSPITSSAQLAAQSTAALAAGLPSFNPQFFGGLDGAAAAAAAAALYSNGFLQQRERLDLDQQVRYLSGPGASAMTPGGAMDSFRLGLFGSPAPGNPLMDSFLAARAGLGNAAMAGGFPTNLGLNFGIGGPTSVASSVASNHLPPSSANIGGSLANNAMMNSFSNSLEQLARQKRDALLASAAAALGSVPTASMFQKR